jgi:hypothetical protein
VIADKMSFGSGLTPGFETLSMSHAFDDKGALIESYSDIIKHNSSIL